MPSVSDKQRKFMGAELQRKREGKPTVTDMTEEQLRDYAKKSLSEKIDNFITKQICRTPGLRLRSRGEGRGLSRGQCRGPIGIPKGVNVMETLSKKIDNFIEKQEKIYLAPGEEPPKGTQVMRGPKGGKYYETRKRGVIRIPEEVERKPGEKASIYDLTPKEHVSLVSAIKRWKGLNWGKKEIKERVFDSYPYLEDNDDLDILIEETEED